MKSALFIPCYNCEKQVIRVIEKITVDVLNFYDFIIFIDNKSTDSTKKIIKSYIESAQKNHLILMCNHLNYGLGGSFKNAINFSLLHQIEYITWFHGDDQANIHDAVFFSNYLKKNKDLDAILGSRFMKGSLLINYSKIREYGNILMNFIFSTVTLKKITDIGSGLNLYKVSALPVEEIPYWPNHICFDVNLLLFLIYKKTIFLPITWIEKDQVSNARNFNVAMTVLKMLFRWRLNLKNTEPFRDKQDFSIQSYETP